METYLIDGLQIKVERKFKEDGKNITEALVDIFLEFIENNGYKIIIE